MDSNKRDRFLQNQRSGAQGTPQPVKPKAFAAQFSDLSGPTNPAGILSPAFLALKLALDRGDTPDNVLQALYDWLSHGKGDTGRSIPPAQIKQILDLPSAEDAYAALVGLIGGKLKPHGLPPVVKQTLQRAIAKMAEHEAEDMRYQSRLAQDRGQIIQRRFGGESAAQIVRHLLQ
jgi:hypothetical protein